eukprot:Gb_32847 [translate_table: standard]
MIINANRWPTQLILCSPSLSHFLLLLAVSICVPPFTLVLSFHLLSVDNSLSRCRPVRKLWSTERSRQIEERKGLGEGHADGHPWMPSVDKSSIGMGGAGVYRKMARCRSTGQGQGQMLTTSICGEREDGTTENDVHPQEMGWAWMLGRKVVCE